MKLKNVLDNASEFLGDANQSILFRCANLALANVAGNYKDCIAVQTFEVTDKRIAFDQFDKTFLKVKSVKCNGAQVSCELFINHLQVPNGRVEVTYACVPCFASIDDSIEAVAGFVSENVLLYGILVEYAFVSGLIDESKIWGEKLEQMLFSGTRTGKGKVIKCNSK